MIKILVVPSDRSGVGSYRSIDPHIALEKYYPNEFSVDIDYDPLTDSDEYLSKYDIIHYHRSIGNYFSLEPKECYKKMEKFNERLKRLNVLSIMDLDDFWQPTVDHPSFLLFQAQRLPEKILGNLKLADNVCTTTDKFKEYISVYNHKVFTVPNAIDPEESQFIHKETISDKLRVGFLGGSSHLRDLELLTGVVSKIRSANLIDKIIWTLIGFDSRGNQSLVNEKHEIVDTKKITASQSCWNDYERIFTDNYSIITSKYKEWLLSYSRDEEDIDINSEKYIRVWTKPIKEYANNYRTLDLSLAPLKDHMFNSAKSPLKVIEAGFHHKALICSNVGPYLNNKDLIQTLEKGNKVNEKGNVLLIDPVHNHSLWFEYIKFLTTNREVVKLMGENLYNTVKDKYSIEEVSKLRREEYLQLLNK